VWARYSGGRWALSRLDIRNISPAGCLLDPPGPVTYRGFDWPAQCCHLEESRAWGQVSILNFFKKSCRAVNLWLSFEEWEIRAGYLYSFVAPSFLGFHWAADGRIQFTNSRGLSDESDNNFASYNFIVRWKCRESDRFHQLNRHLKLVTCRELNWIHLKFGMWCTGSSRFNLKEMPTTQSMKCSTVWPVMTSCSAIFHEVRTSGMWNVGATLKQHDRTCFFTKQIFLVENFFKEKVAHFSFLPPHSLCIWRLVGSGAHSS
jgi:hypothetical protein